LLQFINKTKQKEHYNKITMIKGCDSKFEKKPFKVAANGTTTLNKTICPRRALKI